MTLSLTTPIEALSSVGKKRAELLKRLGIHTVKDMLYHFPFRYEDYSLITPIAEAQLGETITIYGTVLSMKFFVTKYGKKIIEGKVVDNTGIMTIIWFNQQYLLRVIREGNKGNFSGTVSWFGKRIVLSNPTFERESSENLNLHTGRIVPIYPETEGITSTWLREKVYALLTELADEITDYLPEHIQSSYNLMTLSDAIQRVHFPKMLEDAKEAKRRLAFDELLELHVISQALRRQRETSEKGIALSIHHDDIDQFKHALPFSLTPDQERVIQDISDDLSKNVPMNRLIIGDVGSGKTVIAAFAMYLLWKHRYSSVLMAPTQILAEQHHKMLSSIFKSFDIKIDLITGNTSTIDMFSDDHRIIVGTHALLTNQDILGNVGLIVIDEQHRFGVKQRTKLLKQHETIVPHFLTMTATPIPRTIAKTFLGNIDVSFLLSMPSGRKPIKTWLVPNEKRENAYEWIKKQIKETDSQVFIICPLIEESESETLADVKAVKKEYEKLKTIFSEFSIGLLHGNMKPKEKTAVLTDMLQKKHHILLATPVVEVGIDIPNATIIVIETAERFGLSQLHQLRGRVGRGQKQSYCLLFTESQDERALKRLKAMETIHNGPELADLDLLFRGAGDVFGVRQHGFPTLKIASFGDTHLLEQTKRAAEDLMQNDPDCLTIPHLRERIKKAIIGEIHD